ASSVRFDGSKVLRNGSEGWNFVSNFIGERNEDYEDLLGDQQGGNRGLIAEGQLGSDILSPDTHGQFLGYGGGSTTGGLGAPHVVIYDAPRAPLVSLGQFQHAALSRYNHEPGFVLGNSYANPRIPPNQTTVTNFAGVQDRSGNGMLLVDTSYEINQALWDAYFFSTLSPDYFGANSYSDPELDLDNLLDGTSSPINPRMQLAPRSNDTSFNQIIADAGAQAPEALASRVMIKGAFNINSTSKEAWKAILSTMGQNELPTISNSSSPSLSWTSPDGVYFNKFGHVANAQPFEKDAPGDPESFWNGWRRLSADELDQLATEIVAEVKNRGPFRSLADFVNRDPDGSGQNQLKGPLQAALDRTLNAPLDNDYGLPANTPPGSQFHDVVSDEKQSAGYAGYLSQGDLLQSLAPILQARSDYFRIRACGEALNEAGEVVSRAYCEAYVQRFPDYVDATDKAETPYDTRNGIPGLQSELNKTFGRQYRLVSFRWLNENEI
ncbi:MAG: hypothetical protein ACQKBY_00260, partial [Verrucomicrobiales bacterium]